MSAPPEAGATSRALPGWAIPAIAAAAAATQLASFRWGAILPDTVVQYAQVLSGRYEDWHPPVTAWAWRWIGGARFGSGPLLLLDLGLFWIGLGLFAEALRRRGHSWAALAALGVGLWPICFGQMAAILKDSLLAACLTAGAGIAALVLDGGRLRIGTRCAVIALLVIGGATRFNAPLAAAPLLALMLPDRGAGWRSFATGPIAAALLLFAAAIMINGAILRPQRQHPILSQVNFDLAGISVQGRANAYPAGARPPMALLDSCYTPAQFNPRYRDDCGTAEDGLHALFDSRPGAVRLWLTAIARDPIAYARHRLAHWNANQRLAVAAVPADAFYLTTTPNDLGLGFTPSALAKHLYGVALLLARSPLGRPATWLAIAAGVLLLGGNGPGWAMRRALAVSALLYGGGYLVASVAADLRYNLWTMIAAMLAAIGAATARPYPPGRVAFSAIPVALVVVAELAVLAS